MRRRHEEPAVPTDPPTQMAVEIAQQPTAITATFEALRDRRREVTFLARGRRHVLFAARGSSDNAATYGRYLVEVHARLGGGSLSPSIATHYRTPLDLSDALVVSVSQSGETEELVTTQAWARACGAATLAVVNNPRSTLVRGADIALVTQAGPELAVPATKSYTAQLVAMLILGSSLAHSSALFGIDMFALADEIARLIEDQSGVAAAVEALSGTDFTVVSGRGLMLGTALEVALKLEETCLRPVRGYSYADLRHGPIAVVGPNMSALLIAASDGPLLKPMGDLARDLAHQGATVVGIGGDKAFESACAVHMRGSVLPEALAPFGAVIPGQLVAERYARTLGLDPDRPRGLEKVTSTDV